MRPIQLNRVTDTTALAISVIDAKQHLRVDHHADDAYIASLVQAARRQYEHEMSRILLTQTWTATLDHFPAWDWNSIIPIPLTPLQQVTSISYLDADGATQTLGSSVYTVDTQSETPRIWLNEGQNWPQTDNVINAVTITMTMGSTGGTGDVPDDAKHWVRLLVGHLYENRSPVEVGMGVPFKIPHTLSRLGKRVLRFD